MEIGSRTVSLLNKILTIETQRARRRIVEQEIVEETQKEKVSQFPLFPPIHILISFSVHSVSLW